MVESTLWQQAALGNKQAFAQVCEQTWEDLYAYAYRRVQNHEEAEDVTQESYARLWSMAPRLRDRNGEVEGLLRIIALNIIRDGWRRRKARGAPVPLDLVSESDHGAPDLHWGSEPDERLVIQGALDRLPEDQRRVVVLRLIEGHTVRETARRTAKSEAAVRALQYRALNNLARELGLTRKGGVQRD